MSRRKHFHCTSEKQKQAIKASYARKAAQNKTPQPKETADKFLNKFPFWARLKIYKNRTTLVIDEERGINKKTQKEEDLFVHREATHTQGHGEPIIPNPDKDDTEPMYLKSPSKLPKRLFKPHNKDLTMPEDLRQRYDKNNHKKTFDDNDGDKKT